MHRTLLNLHFNASHFRLLSVLPFYQDNFEILHTTYNISSMKKQTNLPEPLDLLRIAGVVTIYCTGFPVVYVNFLHTTQHQLQTARQSPQLNVKFTGCILKFISDLTCSNSTEVDWLYEYQN